MTRADLSKQPEAVAAMFDNVAEGYDRTNAVATMGLEKLYWRPQALAEIAPRRGLRILDLAAGTGASSVKLREAGAEVVSCDFSVGMLRVGKRRNPQLDLVAGDALRLPFADDSFDVVTISWALRNVNDVTLALRDMLRVTKPGGRLVILENSHPTWKPFRVGYLEYMMRAVPVVAKVVSTNPEAYEYLAESVRAWPGQAPLADTIAGAGWSRVQWKNLTGGLIAIHRAVKPG
ncbi:2-octaprenyl-6-methoxy-1,4-benzoquinone methylase /demethylmenaquinone methyltransferase [Kribbella amoyensis]|uniref:Demethylmenaquinone methyltransferase n=1 Tax=Kribbella amoyensis TaxID=996641 RepID=A0A561BLH5_9ACTN|nr:demethylmenaquinone methyltransferase [Kribbella amoyensis]TWD79687.1 2-octaprenyl-6-methoxy-1,4-benzoquinone methylase /demethylmenaquinone methyltransferase [Kribbella amoyensis]